MRAINLRKKIQHLERLPIATGQQGQLIRLGDIASITEDLQEDNEAYVFYQGKPAVEIVLLRATNNSSLHC